LLNPAEPMKFFAPLLLTFIAAPLIDGNCRSTFAPAGTARLAFPLYVVSTGIVLVDASSYPSFTRPATSNSRRSIRPLPTSLLTSAGITYAWSRNRCLTKPTFSRPLPGSTVSLATSPPGSSTRSPVISVTLTSLPPPAGGTTGAVGAA
jgi:hypothetical protein